MPGFRWKLCDYVGGAYAVSPHYKPYLVVEGVQSLDQAVGEISMAARFTGSIAINGLGFQPDILFLVSYRPRYHNDEHDADFGHRGGGMTFGVAGPYQQFTGSTRIQQGFDLDSGIKRWREDCCFNVISQLMGIFPSEPIDILTIVLTSFDADGFTLEVTENLYDVSDPVAWLAMKGDFQVGCMSAGDTSIGGFSGITPTGAVFLSTKQLGDSYDLALWNGGTSYVTGNQVEWRGAHWEATANNTGSEPPSANWSQLPALTAEDAQVSGWDHLTGFAAQNGQAGIWGGGRHSAWGWTTEYWSDSEAIVLGRGANGSAFLGATIESRGQVNAWNSGGIDLQWNVYNNQPYRVGYVLVGLPSEHGVIETNYEKRDGGSQVDFADGTNFEETTVKPRTILMASTNYNFDGTDVDPLDNPRNPDTFGQGGSGGFGWHAYPFLASGNDAYGVHTYANAIAELGHYQNSGTQFKRNCVMPGQGANSQPPAAHQHSINIVPNPRIPGLNYRYAERHSQVKRIHIGVNN